MAPSPSTKTLLRVDASARREGSHSRGLADYFQQRWCCAHPQHRIVARDLARDPMPHLSQATIAAFQQSSSAPIATSEVALSDELIAELEAADHLLISSPLYNLTVPSTLKAYFDHVVRHGRTITTGEHGCAGLLAGRSAFVVTARGGLGSHSGDDDFQTSYLQAILSFLGFAPVRVFALDGTAEEPGSRENRVAQLRAQIDEFFARPSEPEWVGAFSEEDRRQINALRAAQAEAIRRGDAEAYSRLCTDDIRLMIPGHDPVSGRAQFSACEKNLFQRARFSALVKFPERVEGSGDLAIEVGRQSVTTTPSTQPGGVFAARQKYTHVFRRTPQGWRFAVLMSNSCD